MPVGETPKPGAASTPATLKCTRLTIEQRKAADLSARKMLTVKSSKKEKAA